MASAKKTNRIPIAHANPEQLLSEASRLFNTGKHEAANQAWFTAGESFQLEDKVDLALECFRDALIAKMMTKDAAKDWYDTSLEESKLSELGREEPAIALRAFRRLERAARENAFYEKGDQFHVQGCQMTRYMQLSERQYLRFLLYTIWKIVCGYGVNLSNWVLSATACYIALVGLLHYFGHLLLHEPEPLIGDSPIVRLLCQAADLLLGASAGISRPLGTWGVLLVIATKLIALAWISMERG
jgi:hypothetical protein